MNFIGLKDINARLKALQVKKIAKLINQFKSAIALSDFLTNISAV